MSEFYRFANIDHMNREGFPWPWPNFTPQEMADRLTGDLLIVPDFMDWLQEVRAAYQRPMYVTSGYRTPEHQHSKSGKPTGAHVDGMAVDVRACHEHSHELLKIAISAGALGLGIQQLGAPERRYLHIDRWTSAPKGYRPRIWNYPAPV